MVLFNPQSHPMTSAHWNQFRGWEWGEGGPWLINTKEEPNSHLSFWDQISSPGWYHHPKCLDEKNEWLAQDLPGLGGDGCLAIWSHGPHTWPWHNLSLASFEKTAWSQTLISNVRGPASPGHLLWLFGLKQFTQWNKWLWCLMSTELPHGYPMK